MILPGLRSRCDRTDFNEPEAERTERVDVTRILVEACREPYAIGKLQPQRFDWLPGINLRFAQQVQAVRRMQRGKCECMSAFRRKREEKWPKDGIRHREPETDRPH